MMVNETTPQYLSGLFDGEGRIHAAKPYLTLKAEQAKASYVGMGKAHYGAMKQDPQRLSERAAKRIASLMRQSDPCGDVGRAGESTAPLASASQTPVTGV